MGGYIDPAIALSYKPPVVPDALEGFGRVQQLQNMIQQSQNQRQQQQMGGVQLQQAQMELQDQQMLRQLYPKSGGDLGKLSQLAGQAGVSPQTIIKLNQSAIEQKTKLATLDETTLKNYQTRAAAVADKMQGILNAAPEQQQALWQGAKKELTAGGMIPDPTYMPDQFDSNWATTHANAKEMFDAEMKRREVKAAENTAEARQQTADTTSAKETREAGQQAFEQAVSALGANPPKSGTEYAQRVGQLPPAVAQRILQAVPAGQYDPARSLTTLRQLGMSTEQQTQAGQAATNATQTAQHNKVEESQGAQRIGLEAENNNIRKAEVDPYGQLGINQHPIGGGDATGQAYLDTLPASLAARVKAVAEGREPIPTGRAASSGPGRAIVDGVYHYDPDFTTQRAQIRKAFTAGNDGRNIGNLNTAVVHLDQLAQAAKAMDNGSFVPGNKIWNDVKAMFGDSAPTNFQALQSAVSGEMANALKGNATDPEIANVAKSITSAQSPAQLAGAIETHLHTLGTKLNTYQERYQQQLPGDTTYSPVLPSARAVFQAHGFDPTAGGKPAAGGSPAPAGQAAQPSFKVGDSVMYQGKPHKVLAVDPKTGKLTIEP